MSLLERLSIFTGKNSPTFAVDHFRKDVYTSIEDMPIHNWRMILEESDLTYLYIKEGKYTERLEPIWLELQEEHLKEFGISDEMKTVERLSLKLIKLQQKFIDTRDRVLLNFIKVITHQLDEMATVGGIKFGRLLNMISKQMGFRIDTKVFTVYEWYHAVNNLGKDGNSN